MGSQIQMRAVRAAVCNMRLGWGCLIGGRGGSDVARRFNLSRAASLAQAFQKRLRSVCAVV